MHHSVNILVPLQVGPIDISITASVAWLLLSTICIICICVFASIKPMLVPKNIFQNIFEYCIEFIEKQILIPAELHDKRWTPFILSIFLFILINDWVGIIPGSTPATGNINLTLALALIVFFISFYVRFHQKGFIGFIKSIVPAGLNPAMSLLLFPIELISQLFKPFSLALRLFANITAGHLVLLTFIGFSVLFKNIFVSTLSVAGTILVSLFEIFIGFIQAYIFAFLSALMISESMSETH